ncbi:superoxide dismutase family protein [Archangium violaceum]|uniref:superoxide dismutase family protein n=1 Tax=Archangium violaceum TaxID=83451 RepID=UPI002B288A51|nr:superoxide dismutase family protein [Archangium violaceum]
MEKWVNVSLRTTVLSVALSLAACGGGAQATSSLESRSGSSTTGTATFKEDGDQVTLTLEVSGATPGKHGAHIHQTGDCSAPDASSAGGHWNPTSHTHGPADPNHHLGDLGNIEIGQDGRGTLKLSKAEWKIGDGSANDVVGKAIIVHAGEDDLVTDPAGNSGGRVACGVIAKKE